LVLSLPLCSESAATKMAKVLAVVSLLVVGLVLTQAQAPIKLPAGLAGLLFAEVDDPSLLPPGFRESKTSQVTPPLKPKTPATRAKRGLQRVPCHLVKDGRLRVKRDEGSICYIVDGAQSYSEPRVSYSRPSRTRVTSYSHLPESYYQSHEQTHSYESYSPRDSYRAVVARDSYRPVVARDSYRPVAYQSRAAVRTSPRRSHDTKRVWYHKPEGSHRSQIHHVERY